MKEYTIKIETIPTDANYYLRVDAVEITVNEDMVREIVKAVDCAGTRGYTSIPMFFKWLYEGEDTPEKVSLEELYVYWDGELIARFTEKYSGVEVESNLFRIKEVDEILKARKKANVSRLEVAFNSLEDFDEDEQDLLRQYADLVPNSELDRVILYSTSLFELLQNLEDEAKDRNRDFSKFKTTIENLLKANASYYLFYKGVPIECPEKGEK